MKIVAILIMVTALTACGTVAGFGTDLTKSAEWTKEKMSGSKVDLNQNK
jgi:predicted small secreted protein